MITSAMRRAVQALVESAVRKALRARSLFSSGAFPPRVVVVLDAIDRPIDTSRAEILTRAVRPTVRVLLDADKGGTFILVHGGNETNPISVDASAEVVKTELEALPSIPAGSLCVVGYTARWFVQFKDADTTAELEFKVAADGRADLTNEWPSGQYIETVRPATLTSESEKITPDARGFATRFYDVGWKVAVECRQWAGARNPDGDGTATFQPTP